MKTTMLLANLLIAVDYVLIGWLFARQIRLPRGPKRGNAKAFAAYVSLALFFLSLFVIELIASPQSYSRINVVSHLVQGIAGMTFWYLARRHLHITITDRKTYDKANDSETEARLQYLAARAGLR